MDGEVRVKDTIGIPQEDHYSTERADLIFVVANANGCDRLKSYIEYKCGMEVNASYKHVDGYKLKEPI